MRYLKNDLMKMCREQGLNQVDLNKSSRRVTDKEYHAKRRGQEKLNQENAAKKAKGEKPEQTEIQTEQTGISVREVTSNRMVIHILTNDGIKRLV